MNLIRRKIAVAKIPNTTKTVQTFYIVWHRYSSEFFLCDAKDNTVNWSVFKEHAIKFDNGEDALSFCKAINETNRGPGIIELKIIDEAVKEEEDDYWVI